jgi:hypothetical protein
MRPYRQKSLFTGVCVGSFDEEEYSTTRICFFCSRFLGRGGYYQGDDMIRRRGDDMGTQDE